jgi:hypothetical protein
MKEYNSFKYIFPPRPETRTPPTGLGTYERMGFIAQPKLNGSCALLFTNGSQAKLMGRHNNTFVRQLIPEETLCSLHRGAGWMVLVGEYMNKSQRDSKGNLFNARLVIFDILVHNGKHLVGSTFGQRQALLDSLYDTKPYDDFISSIGGPLYRVNNITQDFTGNYTRATGVQMYEGLVLKRPTGSLENGMREANNTGWQVKIRKPTKNYSY